ncbi:hypothetical protein Tco_1195416, partial [Tanacetum coccineum]
SYNLVVWLVVGFEEKDVNVILEHHRANVNISRKFIQRRQKKNVNTASIIKAVSATRIVYAASLYDNAAMESLCSQWKHDERGNDPNDYHLFTPQSHYETEEVSSDKDVDEWLNEELSKRMTWQDKKEEEDALIDILKIGVSFVTEEEGDSSETLPYQQPYNEINSRSFTLPCTIGNLKTYVMANVGAGINMMPKLLFEHLKLANLKKTSMAIEMVIDTLEEPDETILLGRPFLAMIDA